MFQIPNDLVIECSSSSAVTKGFLFGALSEKVSSKGSICNLVRVNGSSDEIPFLQSVSIVLKFLEIFS